MDTKKPKEKIAWLFVGQGSQHKGMGGKDLFALFPEIVAEADDVLGYSIEELCLHDPERKLTQTRFAQPALYVVNALEYFQALETKSEPDYLAGHSLGEYNALLAAGCFDFKTGLYLVKCRGEIMAQVQGGGMAAVLGLEVEQLQSELERNGYAEKLDISNINSKTQIIVSGDLDAIKHFSANARENKVGRVVPLAVSAAFHSQHMNKPAQEFKEILESVDFKEPRIPVISNVTGDIIAASQVKPLLAKQIRSCVLWWRSLMTLRENGVEGAEQIGPGRILSDLWQDAEKVPCTPKEKRPFPSRTEILKALSHGPEKPHKSFHSSVPGQDFCQRHGVRHACIAGAMYRGIASKAMVIRMANNKLLSFFGSGGLPLEEVEKAIVDIRKQVGKDAVFGMNFLAYPTRPALEQQTIDLYLKEGIRYIEASAFTQVTEAIIQFRFHGARIVNGRAQAANKVFAKLSRLEVAKSFLVPPSEEILRKLYDSGRLNGSEVEAARRLPVSSDISMEADSGGHTDGGVALIMLPACVRLRDHVQKGLKLDEKTAIGAAGGIGTPEAIQACFVLGAEFIVLGSINQCSFEAGTSEAVKDILSQVEIHDTTYAPAGDLFITGAKVQVVKRGTLFPARANYLYHIYQNYEGLSAIPTRERSSIERYMDDSLDNIWQADYQHLKEYRRGELARIEGNEKARMARVFKSYFSRSLEYAQMGDMSQKVNFQIHSGPAMGAFNSLVKDSSLAHWRNRHVDLIADELMCRVQSQLSTSLQVSGGK